MWNISFMVLGQTLDMISLNSIVGIAGTAVQCSNVLSHKPQANNDNRFLSFICTYHTSAKMI